MSNFETKYQEKHKSLSYLKSIIRLVTGAFAFVFICVAPNIEPDLRMGLLTLISGYIVAEGFGVAEENI